MVVAVVKRAGSTFDVDEASDPTGVNGSQLLLSCDRLDLRDLLCKIPPVYSARWTSIQTVLGYREQTNKKLSFSLEPTPECQ
jgi:hypothetical protein